MFYEFNSVSREDFKYPYVGKELIEAAVRCRDSYKAAEMSARNRMADMMRDANISQSDDRIAALKKDIEKNGKQFEACSVFVTGFRREPERVFNLSLGDVVFFGLVDLK